MLSRDNRCFTAVVAVLVLSTTLAAHRWPRLRIEDGWIETSSALAFLAASLLLTVVTVRAWKAGHRGKAGMAGVVAGISAILFLSEISFGARIFG